MVQGTSSFCVSKVPAQNWDKSSKISGYEAIQKVEKEKKESEEKEKSSYGAWGPTFKNKDHFVSLHQYALEGYSQRFLHQRNLGKIVFIRVFNIRVRISIRMTMTNFKVYVPIRKKIT
ncbi:hypothetical protein AMK59_7200 [Oryctes borbonicus]|uniref:Uncharacterized protein n=1 Tax=Oryctes borbonicus TaxID=1629725 RepID=A0A0T6AWL6_9SCAR|nr:hypothetical protein AMK59_7200 [Oryctes borbonicus]